VKELVKEYILKENTQQMLSTSFCIHFH